MQLGFYVLKIVKNGQNQPEQDGYVYLNHGDRFSIAVENHSSDRVRVSVLLTINGEKQDAGTWQMDGYDNGVIETPSNNKGFFTFYRLGSVEGVQAGLNSNIRDQGLVSVTFTPEMKFRSAYQRPKGAIRNASRGVEAGGIGLEGERDYEYERGQAFSIDSSQAKTLYIRLGCVSEPHSGPRPFTNLPNSTQIPPVL